MAHGPSTTAAAAVATVAMIHPPLPRRQQPRTRHLPLRHLRLPPRLHRRQLQRSTLPRHTPPPRLKKRRRRHRTAALATALRPPANLLRQRRRSLQHLPSTSRRALRLAWPRRPVQLRQVRRPTRTSTCSAMRSCISVHWLRVARRLQPTRS